MIRFCKICIMPDTRPRIVFNSNGICNACENADLKNKINWSKRYDEFKTLISNIKENNINNNYDCVVPWSGGKDSTSIALKLKLEFNLNPLLVTFSPLIKNECGTHNRALMNAKGFDTILIDVNEKIASKLSKRFFIERGNPKVAWDAGINAAPVRVALNYKIPFIFYAEHGESEYGGLVLQEDSKKKRNLREVIEHQIGDYPENWISDEISKSDLIPYIYPDEDQLKKLNIYYFSYFFRWSMLENWDYVKKNLPDFKTDPDGRTQGTFTNFDSLDDKIDTLYYYMQFIKFGFGRATRDACRMIQNSQLSREEGIKFARLYDNEFPSKNFVEILKYLNLSESEFEEIVDRHRNSEIWKSNINNKWDLISKL